MKCTPEIHAAVLSGDPHALRTYTQHSGYIRRGNEVRECCGQGCRRTFYVLTTYSVGTELLAQPTGSRKLRRTRTTADPAVLGGEEVFIGTRVSVRLVERLIARGVTTSVILKDYPGLTTADVVYARARVRV